MTDIRRIRNGTISKGLDQRLNRLKENTGITDAQIEAIATGGVNDIPLGENSPYSSEAMERTENYETSIDAIASDEFFELLEKAEGELSLSTRHIFSILDGAGFEVLSAIEQLGSRETSGTINLLMESYMNSDEIVAALSGTANGVGFAAKALYDEVNRAMGSANSMVHGGNSAGKLMERANSWAERVASKYERSRER